MKVRQSRLLLNGTSTNTSTGTSQSTSTPENASLVRTLFDLFFIRGLKCENLAFGSRGGAISDFFFAKKCETVTFRP